MFLTPNELWVIGLLTLTIVTSSMSQVALSESSIQESLSEYSRTDKIYLQTDRNQYAAGEDLFYKIYLLSEDLSLRLNEGVVYVVLLSPENEIVIEQKIKMDSGTGVGDVKLHSGLLKGIYSIRAYTNFMRNSSNDFFFSKQIFINNNVGFDIEELSPRKGAVLGIFPEGGDLVKGLESVVALKLSSWKSDIGSNIEVEVKDQDNIEVARCALDELGYGVFKITPEEGKTYQAQLVSEAVILPSKLPTSMKEGMVIQLNKESESQIKINISSNLSSNKKTGGILIGHQDGAIMFQQVLDESDHESITVNLSTFSPGLIHWTVLDSGGLPRAERLSFNHIGVDNFNIDLESDDSYGTLEEINLALDIYDDEGESLPAQMHMSVAHSAVSNASHSNTNIQNYLYLKSDLTNIGGIPSSICNDTEALDKILLTHGWRRFKWQDVLGNQPKNIMYSPEPHLTIKGTISDKNDPSKPVKARGMLTSLSTDLIVKYFDSDENGDFTIADVDIIGRKDLLFQSVKSKGSKKSSKDFDLKGNRNISIEIENSGVVSFPVVKEHSRLVSSSTISDMLKPVLRSDFLDSNIDDSAIELDEFTVRAERVDKVVAQFEDGMVYRNPDTRIRTETMPLIDQYWDIYDVLRGRVPGMEITRPERHGIKKTVILRGVKSNLSKSVSMENGARFMINGSFALQEQVEGIAPSQIAFVDVVRSLSKLNLYGEQGVNGLIMIYLHTGVRNDIPKKDYTGGLLNYSFQGYHEVREFSQFLSPDAGDPEAQLKQSATVYWNPRIEVNEAGSAELRFFTPQKAGVYDIQIEGIAQNGLSIYLTKSIEIK